MKDELSEMLISTFAFIGMLALLVLLRLVILGY